MESLNDKILTACRTELCGLYPGLNGAFAMLPQKDGQAMATDGQAIYTPADLPRMYAESPAGVRRGYLHMLLHCLFLHIRLPDRVDPEDWGLACDLWTEKFIEDLQQPRLHTENPARDQVLPRIGGTPWQIMKQLPEFDRETLKKAAVFDDHSLWMPDIPEPLAKKWEGMSGGGDALGRGNRGRAGGDGEEKPGDLRDPLFDFRRYLRRFTVPREELETDEDSFDYMFYNLGIERYGNMPLLEPLEYKEVRRLDALAIAIDTSASCDAALVRRFLEEVYGIFSSQENFFRKMQVVFFQCDCCLQDKTVITDREQWLDYGRNIKIKGRGGTDYTPVFREIQAMRDRGELKKPRALLYFTDGDGYYPHAPDYETVFVLAGPKKHPELVPKWAKSLCI
mgnify:FL=1